MNYQIAKKLFYWVIQILMWLSLLFTDNNNFLSVFILYLVLVISNFASTFLNGLYYKKEIGSIDEYFNKLFVTPPVVTMSIECFHYRKSNAKKNFRNNKEKDSLIRDVTFRKTEYFKIKSWRDISGTFNLRFKNKSSDKHYMELNLIKEIEFDDFNTRKDYEKQLNSLIETHRSRDAEISIEETKEISMDEYSLFQIKEDEPYFVTWWWFVIFTLFTLPEPYKIYVGYYCFTKDFTLKKIISSKKDLHNSENTKKWEHLDPSIKIHSGEKYGMPPSRDNIEADKFLPDPIQEDIANPSRVYCEEELNNSPRPQPTQIPVMKEAEISNKREDKHELKFSNIQNMPKYPYSIPEPSQIPQQNIIYPQTVEVRVENKKYYYFHPNESFTIFANPKPVKQKFSERFPNSDKTEGSSSKKFKQD